MTWGSAGRPEFKICRGYNRSPHRARYNEDFPKAAKRKLKNGTVVQYAGTLCFTCRRAYERDLRRMNNRLAGKATRPQDAPWKKHRNKGSREWVAGRDALVGHFRVSSELFFKWFDAYLEENGISLESACRGAKVSSRTVRRWRAQGHLQIYTAEKFFGWAEKSHLSAVLYGHESHHRKAA